MKFIKLEILNLASLDRDGGETICFEEGALGDSTIFSIVGPTGSGKSTILDAICLALYNRAPRYPRKKGDRGQGIEIYGTPDDDERNRLAPTDCRNILTRGKKEGYSKLTFLANNGTLYRAEWHVKFLRLKYADAITTLYKITNSDGKPAEEEVNRDELPDIIGLDYDQFLRTVLIAQGAFANFLTAKENDRCALLERLIGSEDMYTGIAAKIKQHKDQAASAYDTIAAGLSAQEKDILPEDALQTLKDRVAVLEAEEQRAKAELGKVTEALRWYATEETLCADMAKSEAVCQHAKANVDAIKDQTVRLQLHDTAAEALSHYKDMKTAESSIARLETQLDKLHKDINEQELIVGKEDTALDALVSAAKQAAEELERQKPHINKAREIAAKLDAAQKAVAEKAKAQAAAEKAKDKAQEDIATNAAAIEKAQKGFLEAIDKRSCLQQETESHCKQLREKAVKAARLYEEASQRLERQDATQLQQAKTAAEQTQADLKAAIRTRQDIAARQARRKKLVEQQRLLAKSNEDIGTKLKGINTEELSAELDTLTKTYTLMTSDNWIQHRHSLAEGEPCPLCGSTAHPYHDDSVLMPVADKLKTLIEEKKTILDSLALQKQQLTQEHSKNDGLIDGITQSLENLACECSVLDNEWKCIVTKHREWPDDCGLLCEMQKETDRRADTAAKELNAYNTLARHVSKLLKEKESAEREEHTYVETSVQQKLKAEKDVADANTVLEKEKGKTSYLKKLFGEKCEALTLAAEETTRAKADVEDKTHALRKEIGDNTPDVYEQSLTTARDHAVKAVDDKKTAIAHMRERLNAAKGSEQATTEQKQTESRRLSQAAEALALWLKAYNAKSEHSRMLYVDDIAILYAATDDWDSMRALQKRVGDAMTAAVTTLRNIQSTHSEHQAKKPEMTKAQLDTRKAQLEAMSTAELVDAKARLQRHDAAKRQAGDMLRQKQDAEQLKREWEQIADAVGADGKTLRKVAQCYTLRFLIEHANAEIRKFNDRYELQQVKHSLGIRVIDHDRADDIRDTTSLSGGETFIVSLGLALGLSALSSRNISFDNLFIDEGFGTLDPDTLATVIDSLAMLQSSQGKKVGVISHTDTMSERIATQIRIIKNGNSGSSHIEIYP